MVTKYLVKQLDRGITPDMDTEVAIDIRLYNESILKSIPTNVLLGLLLLAVKMYFATLATFVFSVHLIYQGFFAGRANINFQGFITSCLCIGIYSACIGYYGLSYGLQYILVTTFIISMINTYNNNYRKYLLVYSCILILSVAFFLAFKGPVALPSPYGLQINMGILLFTLFAIYKFADSFIDYNDSIKADKASEVSELQMRNDEIKSFNHSVAHDMKEPLRTIAGFSKLLYRNTSEETKEKCKSYNDLIQIGISRMSNLLDDLMVYIESSNKQELDEKVDLNIVAHLVQQNLHQKIMDTNAKLEIQDLPTITANLNATTILFQNFISNALKFVKEGEAPHVEIFVKRLEEGLRVNIRDHGIGISPDYQSEIFKAFKRLNSKDKYEGTGLGLSICERIVSQWGGKISIDSKVNKGTTFGILIPNSRVEQEVKSQEEKPKEVAI